MEKSKYSIYKISAIGVLSAMVFVANYFSIPLGETARIHFGNTFCVLSGLLLGPVSGGLCSGIGGFFYDLTNPIYAAEAPITFVMKFVLGFVTGLIAYSGNSGGKNHVKNIIGSVAGSVSYVIVYLAKNFIKEYYLIKSPMETVVSKLYIKGFTSIINGLIAVVIALVLLPIFKSAMERSGISKKLFPQKQIQ